MVAVGAFPADLERRTNRTDHDSNGRSLGDDAPVVVTETRVEAIVADHVEAALAEMRGELDAASRLRGELDSIVLDKAELWRRVTDLEETQEPTARHRKQESGAAEASCYGADEIAMTALNASVALSQSHGQIQLLLSSKVDARTVDQQLSGKIDAVVVSAQLDAKANSSTVNAQRRPTQPR